MGGSRPSDRGKGKGRGKGRAWVEMSNTRRKSRWRRPLRNFFARLAPPLLRVLGRFLFWSLRVEYRGAESLRARWAGGERAIVSLWHNRLLLVPVIASGAPLCIMVSQHRDGEMATKLLAAWGVATVRGSATRGAVGGYLRLVDAYRHGHNLAVLPDGPRGPRYVAKPGVAHLAKSLGAPIYPVAYAASRFVRLRSWDRLIIPLPFARLLVQVGAPITVPSQSDAEQLDHCRLEVERALNALTDSVEGQVGQRTLDDRRAA
jgi:lysophospholipid acyltransferase (LPLAT)-like uncharacterized protein